MVDSHLLFGAAALFLGSLGLFVYIFIFIFISGSKNSGKAYDKFVMEICSPKGDGAFLKTVLTFGYFKRSFKRFYQYYKLKLFPVPTAVLGGKCPDAQLVTLGKQSSHIPSHALV
ncbi:hypothetical protein EON64_00120 [archaeon]|nr:MAG: hypothetical protein EON64_00120 [archaeon]